MIASLLPVIGQVIDRVLPDEKAKTEAKLHLMALAQNGDLQAMATQAQVVKAEVQGDSWLQRNWRPILMLTIVGIIANNYFLAPYVNALFGAGTLPALDLPERLWDLMTIGVGGYVVTRSGEKMLKTWKEK